MQTRVERYNWLGINTIPLTASPDTGPWVKADTSVAGAPTAAGVGGALELTLDTDVEAENVCVYWGDILGLDINEIIRVSFLAQLTASLDAAISVAIGLASARNDAIDTIGEAALFRCIGNNNVVIETDDGLHDNDDIATGETLVAAYKRLTIDFSTGVQTVSPPGTNVGRTGNVLFSMDNGAGFQRRVGKTQLFDMSNYTAGLQPYFQLQKTSDAAVATLSIREMEVEYEIPS